MQKARTVSAVAMSSMREDYGMSITLCLREAEKMFEELEPLNYDDCEEELRKAAVVIHPDPTETGLYILNEELQEVQAVKDRICSIHLQALGNRTRIKQVLDFVTDLYERVKAELLNEDSIAEMRSQELRNAEVNRRSPGFVNLVNNTKLELSKAEGFVDRCRVAAQNIESANKNISRQITVIQLQLEIGEVSRGESGIPVRPVKFKHKEREEK